MKRAAFAHINLTSLKSNLASIRKLTKKSKIMAVVKADAYGHGIVHICNALTDADAFSVAYVNEAIELRENGVTQPILALQGFQSLEELRSAIEHNIQVVIHNVEQLNILKSADQQQTLGVFLKADTGMHRLGFAKEDFSRALVELKSLLSPASSICLMTHLANADDIESDMTRQQLEGFDNLTSKHTYEQSVANSAGVLAWPDSYRDWVRPGLVLYGISPFDSSSDAPEIDLLPVMSLYAPLISIKSCKKGEKIGYGGDFSCPKDMLIGIIAIGYADGYPRHLKSMPNVCIAGKIAPLVGRVSMDMIAVNLDGIEVQVGEVAELWGTSISVTEVAKHAGTISYELLCAAGNSVYKKYIQ